MKNGSLPNCSYLGVPSITFSLITVPSAEVQAQVLASEEGRGRGTGFPGGSSPSPTGRASVGLGLTLLVAVIVTVGKSGTRVQGLSQQPPLSSPQRPHPNRSLSGGTETPGLPPSREPRHQC